MSKKLQKNEQIAKLEQELEELKNQGVTSKSYAHRKIKRKLRALGVYEFSKETREKIRQARLHCSPEENARRCRPGEGIKKGEAQNG